MSEGLLTVEEMSEIPKTAGAAAGRGSSKGVNLFLARQKLIADMMEQESEENCQQAAANEGAAGVRGVSACFCSHDPGLWLSCVCFISLLFLLTKNVSAVYSIKKYDLLAPHELYFY